MDNEKFQELVLQQLQALAEGQAKLTESQKEIRKDLTKLETRMENEAFKKIDALFDGYSLRGDQVERLQMLIDERLDSIETDTRYLVARVAKLEKLAK